MTLQNAIKKLEKNGFKVTQKDNTKFYVAEQEGNRHYIEILKNYGNDDISVIDLRRYGQEDDWLTDYHAGTFCDNINQAIRLSNNL